MTIRSLYSRMRATKAQDAPIVPGMPFVALGDLHGRADLLERFLNTAPDLPIVCVGDYVDRGEFSADVLRMLHARPEIICLAGNHEDMMLDFLARPVEAGPRWLRHGGLQTLASFGVLGLSETSSGDVLLRARDKLVSAMGDDLVHWVANLRGFWQSGNIAVVHAGADPVMPMADQTDRVLRWGHAHFLTHTRNDDVWIVHGHHIVSAAQARDQRMPIDTGAYVTGRLTAAHITIGKAEFQIV